MIKTTSILAVKNQKIMKYYIYIYPPFCTSVKTNIGKRFLKLIFSKDYGFHKILTRIQSKSRTAVCLIRETSSTLITKIF